VLKPGVAPAGRHFCGGAPGGRAPRKTANRSFLAARGFQTPHWSQGGMNRWVISDVNRTEFNAVVAAIQSTDNEH
jgi:anti-sigma factor RsiW